MQVVTILYESFFARMVKALLVNKVVQEQAVSLHAQYKDYVDVVAIFSLMNKINETYYDTIYKKLSGLISEREAQIKKMTKEQLGELVSKTQAFNAKCEGIKSKPSDLQASIMSMAILYVEDFHSKQTEQLSELIQTDLFEHMGTVPAIFQEIVNSFLMPEDAVKTNGEISTICINGKEFKPSNSLMILLKMIVEYTDMVKLNFIPKYDLANRLYKIMTVC